MQVQAFRTESSKAATFPRAHHTPRMVTNGHDMNASAGHCQRKEMKGNAEVGCIRGKKNLLGKLFLFCLRSKWECHRMHVKLVGSKTKITFTDAKFYFFFSFQCISYICWLNLPRYSSFSYDLSALAQNNIVHGK